MDNKPTPEEQQAVLDEAIKAADELEKDPSLFQDKDEEPPITAIDDSSATDNPPVEDDSVEDADPSQEVKEKLKEEVKEKDKKLSASARENQKIYAKNRIINQALVEADDIPEPTEEELTKEYPDWDVMSDTERKFAKETIVSQNWRTVISKAKDQATKIEKWNDSVDEYIDDPKSLIDNPLLEGKTAEFREFATNEANNSVPFKLLVSAFLFEQTKNVKQNKGAMFETGSGGPNDKPQIKSNKISLEEARTLRQTNYDKWKEYNAKGLIDYNI